MTKYRKLTDMDKEMLKSTKRFIEMGKDIDSILLELSGENGWQSIEYKPPFKQPKKFRPRIIIEKKWHPWPDEKPNPKQMEKNNQNFIVFWDNEWVQEAKLNYFNQKWYANGHEINITHWMELPDPPKDTT